MSNETLMTTAENTSEAVAAEATAQTAATAASQDGRQATDATAATPEQQADTQAKADEAAKPQGAPEAYEFKPIDGVELGADVLSAYAEVAKELDLPQDKAQTVLDKMAPVIAARQASQFKAINAQWTDAAKADKEFGGDKLDASLATAKKALDAFGTPELRDLLDVSGFGNNPEVIRFMVRAGKAVSEDVFVSGRAAPAKANGAQSLYSASNMNP